jgi:hypothetical protein
VEHVGGGFQGLSNAMAVESSRQSEGYGTMLLGKIRASVWGTQAKVTHVSLPRIIHVSDLEGHRIGQPVRP